MLALELSLTLAPLLGPSQAAQLPPVKVTGISFIVKKLPGNWTCPAPWWASGNATVACGQTGSYVYAAYGQDIMINVTMKYAQSGTYTVEVRKDLISWPDSTAATYQVSLGASGANETVSTGLTSLVVGPFQPDQGTCGASGCYWPFDIGALREYFVRVYWDGHLIYDNTDTLAVYGILGIPLWASAGRPEIQALCKDGVAPNGFGWC